MADENVTGNEIETETVGASADAEALEEQVDEEPADAVVDNASADEAVVEPAGEVAQGEAEPAGGSSSAPAEPKRKRKRLPRSERPKRSKPKRVPAAERKPIVRLEKPAAERGRRQERQGTVVSDAMEKTIVVRVDVVKAHPRYKKVVRRSAKFHAHDEHGTAKVGDVVRIVETRPLSKTKRWRLAEVVEAAK